MEQHITFERHIRDTAIVFFTVFAIINGLPDDGFKHVCKCSATLFCTVRLILAILILLPEELFKDA
ncbi:hypothetical protein [Alicyclobacillus fodiniaquatilis]|jgi:hypothetical protein|uniref:Uncharacterized protein n=1 Tax=Alicyclobacillus fodiniaquatilis TaxID=1661150 RepID=A0ABW4JPE4_9BACL